MKNIIHLLATTFSSLMAIASLGISFNTVYLQERRELRSELTETLTEIIQLQNHRLELNQALAEGSATASNQLGYNIRSLITLLERADDIAAQIPDLVQANDYVSIALGYNTIGNPASTEKNYQLALGIAQSTTEFSTIHEGYGQFLYGAGRIEDAREQYQIATDYARELSDSYGVVLLGAIYQNWAVYEAYYGKLSKTPIILQESCNAYSRIENENVRFNNYRSLAQAWYASTSNYPDALRFNSCDELLVEASK